MTGGRNDQVETGRYLSRGQDYIGNIARILGDLQGHATVVHELIQNADDATGAHHMRFVVTDTAIEVWNDGTFDKCGDVQLNECEWLADEGHLCDFHSFRLVGSGDKRSRPGTTGAFGIGFTAVYQLTDRPELISSGEHWIVDETAPHDRRIQQVLPSDEVDGTLFRLPWAVEDSSFRRRLHQKPLTETDIATFPDVLLDAVPLSMPFLKELDLIEVVCSGETTRFTRRHEPDWITIASSDGAERRWLELSGSFDDTAQMLKAAHQHVIEPERSPAIRVAIPVDDETTPAVLYATLPTEHPVHIPILVNADLYPASDRKRIKFDDDAPETEWNRAAITAAADVLGSNLADLPAAIGDERLVKLLLAARRLRERVENQEVDGSFGAFWTEIIKRLPTASVVPMVAGGFGPPREVRLWSDPNERAAASLLRSIHVDLVAEPVKDDWYQLRSNEVGIENLHLKHVVGALERVGLTKRRWSTEDPPAGINWSESIDTLWRLIDTLLGIRDRRDDASRTALRACSVAPGWDGTIGPVGDVRRAEQAVQDLLADIEVEATFLDEERLGDLPHLLAEMPVATPSDIVRIAGRALASGEDADPDTRLSLLRWVFDHRQDLDDDDLPRVATLPIFPTAVGPRPLTTLALPSKFEGPLPLASIVELDGVREMEPFLKKLGAEPLTIGSYCVDFLAPAIEGDELTDLQRERAARWIAMHLSEIRGDAEVQDALRSLPLVRCVDGRWRRGSEVYVRDDLRLLVGNDAPIAATPALHQETHRDLYRWLGAADQPRPRDVEAQCHRLARGPADHREAADAIVKHLAQRHRDDAERFGTEFAALRHIAWMPVEADHSRGHRPDLAYLRFQKSLFQSQASFVDIGVVVERESADVLRWLGVKEHPTPEQAVAHLLTYAAEGRPVGKDMWGFLNNNKDAPALNRLKDARCLLLDNGKYVRPVEVYWRENLFGRWRHLLDDSFSQYKGMLDRLGVAERPAPLDAVEVLLSIGATHGGEDAPLLDKDVDVVRACWRLLSEALAAEEVTSADLADLRNGEVVLDARNRLRLPGDVYFRDSLTLAQRFDDVVNDRLIDRPEGVWPALEAAGVENLSDAVTTHVLEQSALERGGEFPRRLHERGRLLVRVLSNDDHSAVPRLTHLSNDDDMLQRQARLRIQQTVTIDGVPHDSAPFDRGALFLKEDQRFLWVDDGTAAPAWLEIARELVRALDVKAANAKSVPSVLRDVLSAESEDAARRELDELGYPALDESAPAVPEPGVATGFGGSDVSASQSEATTTGINQSASTTDGASTGGSHVAPSVPADVGSPPSASSPAGERSPDSVGDDSDRGEFIETPPTHPDREASPSTSRGYTRLRSYVVPAGSNWDAPDTSTGVEQDVDRAAVDAVLAYERSAGREPTEMSHENPGYDVRSEDPAGEVRFIEVKGTGDRWTSVAISRRQYLEARRQRENYWLYVVDRALSDPQVHPIQDPVSQIDQYVFDDGWLPVSEQADPPRRGLAPLNLPDGPEGIPNAVELRDPTDGGTSRGWLSWSADDVGPEWFAVRIEGHGMGMHYRGGVGLVRPLERAPEEDDRVLVRLHDQIDPDTETATTIRLWNTETDHDGRQLAVRLRSESGVAPLTVNHPDQLEVLGEVVELRDQDDLAELGVL